MLRFVFAFGVASIVAGPSAIGGSAEDCNQLQDLDRTVQGCTSLIRGGKANSAAFYNRGTAYWHKRDLDAAFADFQRAIEIKPSNGDAYHNRALVYQAKGELDRAFADLNKALEINPKSDTPYNSRGNIYKEKGDPDRAMSDYNRAITINPRNDNAYTNRGTIYVDRGDWERAFTEFNKAIEINPKSPLHFNNRGWAHYLRGDYDRAIADASTAIELNPTYATAFGVRGHALIDKADLDRAMTDLIRASQLDFKHAYLRYGVGRVYLRKGDYDRAIAELSEAVRLDSKQPEFFTERAAAYEATGQLDRAIADYQGAIALPPKTDRAAKMIGEARVRLTAIERQRHRPQPQRPNVTDVVAEGPATSPGRRVALVIANSSYGAVARLPNPGNDGRAVAASFRRLGFAEVIERYDLSHAAMGTALKDFGDRTANADWAVVYFAGHGMEMNGLAYLIPIDAKLEKDSHVSDETVPLSRVLEKVESARKLRLVILDACRNNPFVARMVRTAGVSRSIGRGLAQIEPEGGVLVAYASKHGTTAEDGVGANSPFAEALLTHLEEPGLEINFLFRKVRDRVMTATGRRQEPYLYGSLPGESLFFKHAEAR